MKAKKLVNIVEKNINNMFLEVGRSYKLRSGDFAPDQDNELDRIKDDLYFLLTAYVNQNQVTKIGGK